jgi:hypothetical protein
MTQYPEMQEEFNRQIKNEGASNATEFLAAKKLAFMESIPVSKSKSVFEYFRGGKAVLQVPSIAKILNGNKMGNHGIPQMPLLVYKAINDEVSTIEETDDLVDKYCKAGVNILYESNTIGGHMSESAGFPKTLEWLSSVFDRTHNKMYSSQGCTIQNVTVAVS